MTQKGADTYVIGRWKHEEDIFTWKEVHRQHAALKTNIKALAVINLEKELERIKYLYGELSPSQRSAFLTQIVYEIMK